MEVYLDNAATTKCADQVIDIVEEVMRKDYGNPSSKHMKGLEAERYVRNSAEIIAKSLKCKRRDSLYIRRNRVQQYSHNRGCHG